MEGQSLGQKLRNFRNRADMSQLDLELEINAAPGSISRIESGKVNPGKETLLRIIKALNIDSADAATFFDINVGENFLKLLSVTQQLSKTLELESLIKLVTDNLISNVKVTMAAVMLWDEDKQILHVAHSTFPAQVREFMEKAMGFKIEDVYMHANNPKERENLCLECIITEKLINVDELYPFVTPFIPKLAASSAQKLIGMKHGLLVPLVFEGRKIGVLGFVWRDQVITETEQLMIQIFADQVAVGIYKIQEYERLKKRVVELEKQLKLH